MKAGILGPFGLHGGYTAAASHNLPSKIFARDSNAVVPLPQAKTKSIEERTANRMLP